MSFDIQKARKLITRHGDEVLVSWATLRYVTDYFSSYITRESGMIHLSSALKVLGDIDAKDTNSTQVRQEILTRHWVHERDYPNHPERLAAAFGPTLANRGLGDFLAAAGDSTRIDEYVREVAESKRDFST